VRKTAPLTTWVDMQRSAIDKLCNGCEVEDQQDDLQHGLLPVNCPAYRVVSHMNGLPQKKAKLSKGSDAKLLV